MRKRLVVLAVILAASLGWSLPALAASSATFSSTTGVKSAICAGISNVEESSNCATGGSSTTNLNHLVTVIINLVSVVVGIIGIIMLVVAGLKFITSGGEANSVASAKKGVIYALIGLVIAALAQVIVHFVLNTSTSTFDGSKPSSSQREKH